MASLSSIVSLILTCLTIIAFAFVASQPLSAYQVLQKYDLPEGLLPEGVAGYDLNLGTGEFRAYINRDCKFKVGSSRIEYSPVVTGVISKGRLANLEGVKVHVLFFWAEIGEVIREGDDLRFNFGVSSATYPVGDFGASPRC